MLCLFSLETVIASTSTFKYGVFFLSNSFSFYLSLCFVISMKVGEKYLRTE